MRPQILFKKYQHLIHHRHLWLPIVAAALIAGWLVFHPTSSAFDPTGLSVAIEAGEQSADYTSPEIPSSRFNALFVRFEEGGAGEVAVAARFRPEDGSWTDWQPVEREHEDLDEFNEVEHVHDADDEHAAELRLWSGSILTAPATAYQFRVQLLGTSGYGIQHFALETRDITSRSWLRFFNDLIPRTLAQVSGVKVISRTDWGANPAYLLAQPKKDAPVSGDTTEGEKPTSLRERTCQDWQAAAPEEFKTDGRYYDTALDGSKVAWPRTYSPEIRKLVIHHTAGGDSDVNGDKVFDAKDAAVIVRAIYYRHAVYNGWGDVGYHYLVDPFGNVYEGRTGGEYVIGAHAFCANTGTIGVALLGNFEEGKPTPAAMQAVSQLVGELGILYRLDPAAESTWHTKLTPNVVGHRDYGYTRCPGTVEDLLPDIRTAAADYVAKNRPSDRDYDYRADAISPINLAPLASGTATLRLENNGKKAWPAGTRFLLRESELISNRVGVLANRGEPIVARLDRELGVGGVQTLTIPLVAGLQAGRYAFTVTPQFGQTEGRRLSFTVAVHQPVLDYEVVQAQHPPRPLPQGEVAEAVIELRNKSSFTWAASGDRRVYMAAVKPTGRKSVFTGSSEFGQLVADTPPGGVGRFVMRLTAPEQAKRYVEAFAPAVKDSVTLPDYGMYFDILVREPRFSADVFRKSGGDELKFLPGETKDIFVELKNTSQLTWQPEAFRLVVVKSRGGITVGDTARIAQPVKFGETVRIAIPVTASTRSGRAVLSLRPQWTAGASQVIAPIDFAIEILKSELRAALVEPPAQRTLTVGATDTVTIAYKNTGTIIWKNSGPNAVKLGTYRPADRASAIYDPTWPATSRAAMLTEAEVRPGEIGHFTFVIRKKIGGRQDEVFAPVMEGIGWMTQEPVKLTLLTARIQVNSSTARQSDSQTALAAHKSAVQQQSQSEIFNLQSDMPTVRVRLAFPHDRADIGGGWFTITDDAGKPLFRGQWASIWWDKIKDGKIYRFVPDDGVILAVTNWRHHPGWTTKVNDNRYRGVLEVRAVDGKFTLINELPLEDYVRGIAEPLPTDPPEKAKLLAILARSYAAYYTDPAHRKFPGKPYDGSDNPAEFQKYLGYSYELRGNMPAAAEATRGQVVTHDGAIVKTPYFTSSGGRTKTAAEARWVVKDFLFTQSVEDPWSCGGTSADIGKKLSCPEKARGHGVGISGAGMTGMAREGKTLMDILNYFYDGVSVETKWQ